MDWLTFTTEITKALAWPIAVVFLIFLVRKPLASLLPDLRHFKWKDFEIDFEKKIAKIEEQADLVLLPPETIEDIPEVEERTQELALRGSRADDARDRR